MTSKEWKKCKLGDIAEVTKLAGFEFTKYINYDESGEIIALRALNLRNGILDLSDIKRIKKSVSDSLTRSKLYINDILLTYTGNGYGDCAIIKENDKYHLAPNICKISPKIEIVDPYYLYSYIRSKQFYTQMTNNMVGSGQPTIPMKTIRILEIPISSKNKQQKIAKVLSAIDDKIELNNSINNNLEQQIKYLYNDYFCNCNEEIKITELIDVRDGTHDSPKSTEQGKHLITSKHLKKYGVDKSTANIISEFDYAKINERSIVCTNDILISMIGTVGIVSLIIENPVDFAVKNVGIFKTSNFIEYTYYIHCFLNSNNTQNYIKSHLAGTTQKYISLGELRNLIINKPDESQLNKFNLIVHPLYQQIILNVKENVRLTQLRDTLLPKLMSGEIDVSEVDISADKLLFNKGE